AGKCAVEMNTLTRDCLGDFGSGDIFSNVVRLKPRHDDFFDAGGFQSGNLGRADQCPLFEYQAVLTDRVHGGGAKRPFQPQCPQFHDAAVAAERPPLPTSASSISGASWRFSVIFSII